MVDGLNKKKKYFIKDTSLKNIDNDMFNYANISKVVNRIIENNEPPFNLAIIGKWGLGKSSLINIVKSMLKSDKNVQVQEINAWKYEKESLKKVFLKQLWKGMSGDNSSSYQVINREFDKIINSEISSNPDKNNKAKYSKQIIHASIVFLCLVVVTFLGFWLYKYIQFKQLLLPLTFSDIFLGYCRNISTLLFIPIILALLKIGLDIYHEKEMKKIELKFPIETVDDYELFLENTIQSKLKKNPNLKIVTIIDDLDRLSIDKIVEALDALKAFVGFKNCVFIVPFDDEIIKLALEKRRNDDFDDNADIIESELILDKLFQYKIYLPPLLSFDINKYAEELIEQEIPDFLDEYCSLEVFSKLLRKIIIHSGVTTPRQVKKLINSFINNYMIAIEREKSEKVKNNLFTSESGQEQIAKISVLQADFNHFYDLLFLDFNYLDKILEIQNDKTIKFEKIDNNLKCYFEEDDKSIRIKEEYEELFNFLNKTQKYSVDNISAFMYIAQDDISIQIGDQYQQRAVNALRSQNNSLLADLLAENPSTVNFIDYYIQNNNIDINESLFTIISVFNYCSEDSRIGLADTIIERSIETNSYNDYYSVPIENIMRIKQIATRKDFANQFFENYLQIFTSEKQFSDDILSNNLEVLQKNWSQLSSKQKNIIKSMSKFVIVHLTDYSGTVIDKFINVISDDRDIYNFLWDKEWFVNFCEYLASANDFKEENLEHLKKIFGFLMLKENTDDLSLELLQLADYPTLLKTLDEILTTNICEEINQSTSTAFSEKLVSANYEENNQVVYSLLSKLNYNIDENNEELFNGFLMNYADKDNLENIIETFEYIGEGDGFEFLNTTISSLITSVFQNNSNNSLFEEIVYYFTNSQKEELLAKLNEESKKPNKDNYDQENFIIYALFNTKQYEEILNTLVNELVPTVKSYYSSYPKFLDFMLVIIGDTKNSLYDETISVFLEFVRTIFNAQQEKCIQAISSLSGVLIEEQYKDIFPLLVDNVKQSTFEKIFGIVIDNDKVRPRDTESLIKYNNFLINNIGISEYPNKVLNTISTGFSKISDINKLISESLKNEKLDKNELVKLTMKFINNIDDTEKLTDVVLKASESSIEYSIIIESLEKLDSSLTHEIRENIKNKFSENDNKFKIIQLKNVLSLSKTNISDDSNDFICSVLNLSYKYIDQLEMVSEIILDLENYKQIILMNKIKIVETLRYGYLILESDLVKISILELVSELKLRREFKKGLSGNHLEFYKDNIK